MLCVIKNKFLLFVCPLARRVRALSLQIYDFFLKCQKIPAQLMFFCLFSPLEAGGWWSGSEREVGCLSHKKCCNCHIDAITLRGFELKENIICNNYTRNKRKNKYK